MDGKSNRESEKDESSSYMPPAGVQQNVLNDQLVAEKESLSATALTLSLASLFGPMIVFTLAMFRIIDVRWDSLLVPGLTLFIGFPLAIAALIISVVARVKYRTWKAMFSILTAVLAIPGVLLAAWLLAMIGLASHPV